MVVDVVAVGVLAGSACGVEGETDGKLEPEFVVTVLGWDLGSAGLARGPAALGVVRPNTPSLEAAAKKRAVLADSSEGVPAAEEDAVVTELAMGQDRGAGADKGGMAKLDGAAGSSPLDEITDTDTGVATVGAKVGIGVAGEEVRRSPLGVDGTAVDAEVETEVAVVDGGEAVACMEVRVLAGEPLVTGVDVNAE